MSNRLAGFYIHKDQFSHTLKSDLINNYLPKDSKVYVYNPMGYLSLDSRSMDHFYFKIESDKFKKGIGDCFNIPEIKITLTKHPTLNYYTVSAFDMSHVLDTKTTVTLPKALEDSVLYGNGYFTYSGPSPEPLVHSPEPSVHTCKFDQQYTGLVESFKYCNCGKKE